MRLVEDQAARRLMLRSERDHWRFTDETWQPFLMARREAIVASGDDVVQLVQRIAVRAPGLAFLIGQEEVARFVEGERVGNADAGGDGLKLLCLRIPLLNRPAKRVRVVKGNLFVRCAALVTASFEP